MKISTVNEKIRYQRLCELNERYHFAVGVPIGLAAAELTVEGGSSDFDVFYLNY